MRKVAIVGLVVVSVAVCGFCVAHWWMLGATLYDTNFQIFHYVLAPDQANAVGIAARDLAGIAVWPLVLLNATLTTFSVVWLSRAGPHRSMTQRTQ